MGNQHVHKFDFKSYMNQFSTLHLHYCKHVTKKNKIPPYHLIANKICFRVYQFVEKH